MICNRRGGGGGVTKEKKTTKDNQRQATRKTTRQHIQHKTKDQTKQDKATNNTTRLQHLSIPCQMCFIYYFNVVKCEMLSNTKLKYFMFYIIDRSLFVRSSVSVLLLSSPPSGSCLAFNGYFPSFNLCRRSVHYLSLCKRHSVLSCVVSSCLGLSWLV
jgi:hypothetical protein